MGWARLNPYRAPIWQSFSMVNNCGVGRRNDRAYLSSSKNCSVRDTEAAGINPRCYWACTCEELSPEACFGDPRAERVLRKVVKEDSQGMEAQLMDKSEAEIGALAEVVLEVTVPAVVDSLQHTVEKLPGVQVRKHRPP